MRNIKKYDKIKGVRSHELAKFRQSPMHYKYIIDLTPEEKLELRKEHHLIGDAVHCKVLEAKEFDGSFFTLDSTKRPEQDKTMASNINKAWKAEVYEENKGKDLLTLEHVKLVGDMCAQLEADSVASALIHTKKLKFEQIYTWQESGLDCKAMLDADHPDFSFELKSCYSADPNRFGYDILKFGYHIQIGMQADGRSINLRGQPVLTPDEIDPFYIIAVEKQPPHGVAVYLVDNDLIYEGVLEYRRNIKELQGCINTKTFEGYSYRASLSNGIFHILKPDYL